MLVHMLRSNPKVICHGEVFNGSKIGALTVGYRVKRENIECEIKLLDCYLNEPHIFFYKYIYDLQGRLAAGFKFKTDELFNSSYSHVAQILAKDTDVKIVHLYREDLIGQYVSHQVVLKQTGVTLVVSGEEKPEVSSFKVNVGHFKTYVEDVFRREDASLNFYSKHRSFVISYEQAVNDNEKVLKELQEFIGVPPIQLKKSTEKIITRPTSEVVSNYEEIYSVFNAIKENRPILASKGRYK